MQNGTTLVLISESLARYIADSEHPTIIETIHNIAKAAVESKVTDRNKVMELNASVYAAQEQRVRTEAVLRQKENELEDSRRKQAELQAQLERALAGNFRL